MERNRAADIVQDQLDAYNARNIDAFMAVWAEDAQYFEFPDTLLARGTEEIRARHLVRFQEPNLHGRLINRIAVGNLVVDQERVSRTFPEGPGTVDVIAIYEVVDGKIARAWFKMDTPRSGADRRRRGSGALPSDGGGAAPTGSI